MAKKSTTKKPTTKTAAKRAPAKRPVAKTTARKKSQKVQPLQSFKLAREQESFSDIRANRQTLYWAIFALAILILGLWLIKVNVQISELYNQIDENRVVQDELDARLQEALKRQKQAQ